MTRKHTVNNQLYKLKVDEIENRDYWISPIIDGLIAFETSDDNGDGEDTYFKVRSLHQFLRECKTLVRSFPKYDDTTDTSDVTLSVLRPLSYALKKNCVQKGSTCEFSNKQRKNTDCNDLFMCIRIAIRHAIRELMKWDKKRKTKNDNDRWYNNRDRTHTLMVLNYLTQMCNEYNRWYYG